MSPGQWVAIILIAVVAIGYVAGTLINRQKGERAHQWLYAGLKALDPHVNTRWFGGASSGGRLVVYEPRPPFRAIEARFVLEPRENLPYWLYTHFQGRRDEIILLFNLRENPGQNILAGRVDDPHILTLLRQAPGYESVPGTRDFIVMTDREKSSPLALNTKSAVERYPGAIFRLAIQPEQPHVVARLFLEPTTRTDPVQFFQALSSVVSGSTQG